MGNGTAPKLSRRMRACVNFANFARNHKLDPFDLAELLTLADKAFHAGEREANTGKSADRQRVQFEAKAKSMRFEVYWPGLLPGLKRRGVHIYLPEC